MCITSLMSVLDIMYMYMYIYMLYMYSTGLPRCAWLILCGQKTVHKGRPGIEANEKHFGKITLYVSGVNPCHNQHIVGTESGPCFSCLLQLHKKQARYKQQVYTCS